MLGETILPCFRPYLQLQSMFSKTTDGLVILIANGLQHFLLFFFSFFACHRMALTINTVNKQETSWNTGKTRLDLIRNDQLLREPNQENESHAVQAPTSNNAFLQPAHSRFLAEQKPLAVSRIRTFATSSGPSLSTQVASLPTGTQQADLKLSYAAYGLPPRLIKNFSSLGLNLLYPWQAVCL